MTLESLSGIPPCLTKLKQKSSYRSSHIFYWILKTNSAFKVKYYSYPKKNYVFGSNELVYCTILSFFSGFWCNKLKMGANLVYKLDTVLRICHYLDFSVNWSEIVCRSTSTSTVDNKLIRCACTLNSVLGLWNRWFGFSFFGNI